jgi:hypothetical protein
MTSHSIVELVVELMERGAPDGERVLLANDARPRLIAALDLLAESDELPDAVEALVEIAIDLEYCRKSPTAGRVLREVIDRPTVSAGLKAIVDRALGRDDQARTKEVLQRARQFAAFSNAAKERRLATEQGDAPEGAVKLQLLRPIQPRA